MPDTPSSGKNPPRSPEGLLPWGDLSDPEDLSDRVFKALASRPRRQILLMLASGAGADDARCCGTDEICACVFSERLKVSAATISHHLKILQEASLVSARKDAQWVYYSLRPEVIASVADELRALIPCCCTAEGVPSRACSRPGDATSPARRTLKRA